MFRKGPFSKEYQTCIKRLLDRDPKSRLGSRGDIDEVMSHPFFAVLDREALTRKEVPSQYKPKAGTKHVAKEFRKEDAKLSLAPTPQIADKGASFLGFTFVAPATALGGD